VDVTAKLVGFTRLLLLKVLLKISVVKFYKETITVNKQIFLILNQQGIGEFNKTKNAIIF
jgi:hypothetical protein